MAGFERQVNIRLRTSAESEEEAQAASDRWVQALVAENIETVRRLMDVGTIRVMAADQGYPEPLPSEGASLHRLNLASFLTADAGHTKLRHCSVLAVHLGLRVIPMRARATWSLKIGERRRQSPP